MRIRLSWWVVILYGGLSGCAAQRPLERTFLPIIPPGGVSAKTAPHLGAPTAVTQVSYSSTGDNTFSPAPANAGQPTPTQELTASFLVEQVLARNPSLAQMTAAWEAASARYPQAISLEDPMLMGRVAPGALGSNNVNGGYMIEISQKLPFPGKRKLRGDGAQAEANAAGLDIEDMRLQLIEATQTAFYDYFLVSRALEWNDEGLKLLQRARQDASTRYEAGKVEQQDVLQADVEIGRERERRLGLEELRQITIARINTLMHLPPDNPLAQPPRDIKLLASIPMPEELRAIALSRRPDLQALSNRIAVEQAAVALAKKEVLPDVQVLAGYDSFWQEKELRAQLGMRVNLPVYKARRFAAIAEAQAKLIQRQAELDRQTDQVNSQVQEAYEKANRAEKSVRLYEKTILPAAESNANAARSSYVAGKIAALSRIEAERSLVNLRDRYYEAVADYFRRRATLERVIGGPIGQSE